MEHWHVQEQTQFAVRKKLKLDSVATDPERALCRERERAAASVPVNQIIYEMDEVCTLELRL